MAKRTVNKTQTVLDYLKTHPAAQNREVAAALTKRGIKITANYVATIKSRTAMGRSPPREKHLLLNPPSFQSQRQRTPSPSSR